MASPQKENGYTPIAHTILEALSRQVISPDEWRILMIIFRKTYGWDKKQDHISHTQFSEITGISRNHIPRIINKLLARNIIYRVSPNQGTGVPQSRDGNIITYGFQKDFDRWVDGVSPKRVSPNQGTGVPQSGPKVSPKQGHTKETIQKKEKKEQKLCDDDFWKEVRGIYVWVNVDEQIAKMKGYQLTPRGKNWKMTKRSVISWLNRIDKPLEIQEDDPYKNLEYVKGGNKEEVIQ